MSGTVGELTEERRELAGTAARLLADAARKNPLPPSWDALPVGLDRALWDSLAELGFLGLTVPESAGGAGAELFDLCVLAEQVGAALPAVPFTPTVAVTELLAGVLDAQELVRAVIAGQRVVVAAWETFPLVSHPSVGAVGAVGVPGAADAVAAAAGSGSPGAPAAVAGSGAPGAGSGSAGAVGVGAVAAVAVSGSSGVGSPGAASVAASSVAAGSVGSTSAAVGDGLTAGGRREGLALDGGRVSGALAAVPFGADADAVLGVLPDGRPVLVELAGPRVRRSGVASLDVVEPLASVVLDGAPAVAFDEVEFPLARLRTVLAAELLGTGRRALEGAVGYAKQRYQFGRPIGSFQAVKHLLADRHVQLDAARLLVDTAALEPTPLAAVTALAAALDAADAATADALQVHGGIGFTWEHPSHVLLKRARARRCLLGSPAATLNAIAEHILPRA